MKVELLETSARATATRPRRGAASTPLLILLAALCCALNAGHARGQAKPNIADDVEDKKKGSAQKPGTETRPPLRRRHGPAPRRPAQPAGAEPLEVTFHTGLAEADIFLNQSPTAVYKLGRSGADGRLVTRLPRGAYTITASRPGSRVERRQIEVRPGSTTFSFNLTETAGVTAAAPSVVAPLTAGDVFRRYLDPKQTDDVTDAEWQLAQTETAAAFAANPLDPQVEAQALFTRGQLAYLRRDFARAVTDFNAAALRLPTLALAYYGLGNAYLGLGRLNEAARAYQQAAQISPQLAMPYRGWGDVLARQNKNREALRYYERARVLGYTSTATRQVAARILLKERRWSEALRELLEVSKTSPSAEVFVGVGDAYVGLGQPANAEPAYRRALELDPESAAAHYKFGELAYSRREYAAAAESLERALLLDPAGALIDRARARDLLGKASAKARAAR